MTSSSIPQGPSLAAKVEAREESTTSITLASTTFTTVTVTVFLPVETTTPSSQQTSTFSSIFQPISTTSSTSTQQPSQTPTSDGGRRKLVVAHHMVGNTFSYTKQDWLNDIVLAHESGIDGFALNTGRDPWEPARIADA